MTKKTRTTTTNPTPSTGRRDDPHQIPHHPRHHRRPPRRRIERETPLDEEFVIKTLRRFSTGRKIPAAQLQHLEEGGFICATDNGNHHLTVAGAELLRKD